MTRRLAVLLSLPLVLPLALEPAAAQIPQQPTPYVLTGASNYQEGCFPPCQCPVLLLPLGGTFRLDPLGFDGLFFQFDVAEVEWKIGYPPARPVVGSGTYRVGGEFVAQHELVLDLLVGDEPQRRFQSGLAIGGGNFPLIDIAISVNGMFCYDRVFELHARPAPRLDVARDAVSWQPVAGAVGYDLVTGDLTALRGADGGWADAVWQCLADDHPGTSVAHDEVPAAGEARWFLMRWVGATTSGSYDSGYPSQIGSRDAGIDGAAGSCP